MSNGEHSANFPPPGHERVLEVIGGISLVLVAGGVLWYRSRLRNKDDIYPDLPPDIDLGHYSQARKFLDTLADSENNPSPARLRELTWSVAEHIVRNEPTTTQDVVAHFVESQSEIAPNKIKRVTKNLRAFHLFVQEYLPDEDGHNIKTLVHGPVLECLALQTDIYPELSAIAQILDERRQHLQGPSGHES